jgi:hypothetical protein
VSQQGDHISCELFLAKESASRFFHYKSSACPTNAPGNDAWRTQNKFAKSTLSDRAWRAIGLSYCPQSTETHMGKKNPLNLQQDGDAETRGFSRPEIIRTLPKNSSAKSLQRMVTPRTTRASRPSAPPEPAITDDLLVAKILVYHLDAIGCLDVRCFHQGHGLAECRRPTRLATVVN